LHFKGKNSIHKKSIITLTIPGGRNKMKRIIALLFCVALLLSFGTTAYTKELCSSVTEAKNLYKNGYGLDAVQCLRGIIREAAADNAAVDLEIYFLMGNWALVAGAGNEAEEYWSKPGVAARYGAAIADEYVRLGMNNARENPGYALNLFKKAARYNASVTAKVAAQLVQVSASIGNKAYFEMAVALDPSLAPKIGNDLRNTAEGLDPLASSALRGLASTIDPTRASEDQAWAMRKAEPFFTEALIEARQADLDGNGVPYLNGPHEQKRRQLKQTAIAILNNAGLDGKAIAEERVPEAVIYQLGEHIFNLKAGEQTSHWVEAPLGVYRNISSDGDRFQILCPDGKTLNAWEISTLPRAVQLKLIAVQDKPITLKIRR
jgi:hypothetical protein